MYTKSTIEKLLKEKLSKEVFNRILPQVVTNKHNGKKSGYYVALNTPVWVNVDVDDNFTITTNNVTFTITNKKLCVKVWIDSTVPGHITIF